ncbi:MAG: septum site-determining protein MinC, partial [Lachnospiraceae bacterium]|nr:septum site-determining protein MinC [Lachnospiraceae bacterium]
MKDAVLIKSFSNGITLLLNEEVGFEQIIEELAFKFKEAKNFFGSASVALSIEGKDINSAQEQLILETIRENSNVNIMCIVGHDEETNKHFIKALQH